MREMENIVRNAGWLDKSPDGLPCMGNLTPVIPDVFKDGMSWRKDVLEKRKEVQEKKQVHVPDTVDNDKDGKTFTSYDEVKIVDMSYLSKDFKAIGGVVEQEIIDTTVLEFCLNKEQERAFRIVANHATHGGEQKLNMYLGGMGGTGKSQVIKALIKFFEKRKESHRFIVLAPTGSAAALLSGSTYHSVLGINDKISNNPKAFANIQSRLRGVDYIFFDEVSMLSCHDLYKISAQLAKAFNLHEVPFGGINIIFAGDFAQLPPAMNVPSLYSGKVGTHIQSRMTISEQEAA